VGLAPTPNQCLTSLDGFNLKIDKEKKKLLSFCVTTTNASAVTIDMALWRIKLIISDSATLFHFVIARLINSFTLRSTIWRPNDENRLLHEPKAGKQRQQGSRQFWFSLSILRRVFMVIIRSANVSSKQEWQEICSLTFSAISLLILCCQVRSRSIAFARLGKKSFSWQRRV
jgi:hypothetical protein